MKNWKRTTQVLLLSSLTLLAACSNSDDDDDDDISSPTPPVSQAMDLTILHINDHHSNLDSKSKTLLLKNAAGTQTEATVDAGGFPRVTAAINELSTQSPNVLELHAG